MSFRKGGSQEKITGFFIFYTEGHYLKRETSVYTSTCRHFCWYFVSTVSINTLFNIFSDSGVHTLDVSCNSFGSLGVELVLCCLNPRLVTTLNFSGTVTASGVLHLFLHHIEMFLTQVASKRCLLEKFISIYKIHKELIFLCLIGIGFAEFRGEI